MDLAGGLQAGRAQGARPLRRRMDGAVADGRDIRAVDVPQVFCDRCLPLLPTFAVQGQSGRGCRGAWTETGPQQGTVKG